MVSVQLMNHSAFAVLQEPGRLISSRDPDMSTARRYCANISFDKESMGTGGGPRRAGRKRHPGGQGEPELDLEKQGFVG